MVDLAQDKKLTLKIAQVTFKRGKMICSNLKTTLFKTSYYYLFLVDCFWGTWSGFSECSADGIRTRFRTKTREEINGGTCKGQKTESKACPGKYSKEEYIDSFSLNAKTNAISKRDIIFQLIVLGKIGLGGQNALIKELGKDQELRQ